MGIQNQLHPKFSEKYGIENHEVTTEDGYILSLMRVVKKNESEADLKKPPVLIIHGLASSATFWCLNTPEKTLPGILTESGYDCFLLNLRGTPLSKRHITLKKTSKTFWDFGWYEMSIYDLPATINYILDITGNSQLFCCTHSMGGSTILTMLSLKPELTPKIKLLVLMSPAVYATHVRSTGLKCAARFFEFMGRFRTFRIRELGPESIHDTVNSSKSCCLPCACINRRKLIIRLIQRFSNIFGATNNDTIDKERFSLFLANIPVSTSAKTVIHGMQCVISKKFRHFDYGRSENFKRYGVGNPPLILMTGITAPVVVFYSDGDAQVSSEDTIQLARELQNVVARYRISDRKFAHAEFMIGNKADCLVFDVILKNFQDCLSVGTRMKGQSTSEIILEKNKNHLEPIPEK